jgi:hypothetical protein
MDKNTRFWGGALVLHHDYLHTAKDGSVRVSDEIWHWVGMAIIDSQTGKSYIVLDAEGNLEEVE